jgi:CHAD domain-containing protein
MQPSAAPQKFIRPTLRSGTRTGIGFVANLDAAVVQIRANAPGVAAGRGAEYLHQLRVGIRRLRSTLRAFRELIRRKPADRFERRLRAMLGEFGTARDWDVFEEAFGPGLRRHARRPAEAARRRARSVARSAQFRFLPDEILAWARGGPWRKSANPREPLVEFARRALEKSHARLLASADDIDWREAARRHRVRIRVKRLRHGCDCFAPAWSEAEMQPLLGCLRRLQGVLGKLNDIEVQRILLQGLASSGASAQLVGAAMRDLGRREQGLFRKLRRAWPAFVAVSPYWRPAEVAAAAQ